MKLTVWEMIGGIAQFISEHSRYYVSVKVLPKKIVYPLHRQKNRKSTVKKGDIALVLQGPLYLQDNFTWNTVKLYNEIFPNVKIIISTWENEDQEALEKLEKLNCVVIKNELLQDGGVHNINNQIITSLNGLKRAKQEGVKYVLKSRTDQRIYYSYAFDYMLKLIEVFPLSAAKTESKKRIVVIDNYTNSYSGLSPFVVPDYFYFGEIDEVMRIFDVPFKNKSEYLRYLDLSYEEQFKAGVVPEAYFLTNYLSKYYPEQQFVMDDNDFWKQCRKECLIQISPWDIDLYWPKYRQRFFQPTNWKLGGDEYYETNNSNFMNWLLDYEE